MKTTIIIIILLIMGVPSYPTISDATISQEFGYLGHVGIDFFVPVGTEVYADLAGVVIQEVDDARCYGRYLTIKHIDGNKSLYAHLSEFKVKIGSWVRGGQLIALSGGDPNDNIDGDGWSNAAHLHWEVRVKEHLDNNLYNIDPLKYLLSFSPPGLE